MKSLKSYLLGLTDTTSLSLATNLDDYCFSDYLQYTFIEEVAADITTVLPPPTEINTYFELIDHTIQFLVSTKSRNVLVEGYKKNANEDYTSVTTLINPLVSFGVNHLKNVPYWNMIYNSIGKSLFLNLLLNTRCFVTLLNGSKLQVFGVNLKRSLIHNQQAFIDKTSLLQRFRSNTLVGTLLPRDKLSILSRILQSTDTKHINKKHRNLDKLLDRIVHNDSRNNYNQMFLSIIPSEGTDFENNFNNTSDIKHITRLVIVVFGALFPLETWGTLANKKLIVKLIVEFIRAPAFEKMHIHQILKSIKISEIAWLGKSGKATSKQDSKMRAEVFTLFVHWVFKSIICRILTSFWYITESPSVKGDDSKLLYFPHYKWNKITSKWMNAYSETDLSRTSKGKIQLASSITDSYNFGTLKLIPKASDFRLICVPSRIPFYAYASDPFTPRQQFKYEFYNNSVETIAPIRQILSYKIQYSLKFNTHIPKCKSKHDIGTAILNFRCKLKKASPNAYILKFDMKHCYDRLDHGQIMSCLDDLFALDPPQKLYFVRQFSELSKLTDLKRHRYVILEDENVVNYNFLDVGGQIPKTPSKFLDRTKTVRFTTGEILNILKSQIFESVLAARDDVYKRKRGLFQGSPLLSVLCDLVYNRLTEREFSFLNGTESLLLRVVDDFMLITTEEDIFKRAKVTLESKSLEKYGAYINTAKTRSYEPHTKEKCSTIEFLGLNINVQTLSISRETSRDSFPAMNKQVSFKAAYKYLSWVYNVQLQSYLINTKLESIQNILQTIIQSLEAIIDVFCENFITLKERSNAFDANTFVVFLLELLDMTTLKFKRVNTVESRPEDAVIELTCSLIVSEFKVLIHSKICKLDESDFILMCFKNL